MFAFFERLIKPFPAAEPTQPPQNFFKFCYHYTKGIELYLLLMALFTAIIAILEVTLYGFLGQLVDWLANKDPATFFATEKNRLIIFGTIVIIGLPFAVLVHSLVIHQTLLGNYPMIMRWQAHRYLLGQSLAFYQEEFAGRIATKVMQTALAVRESVMKILDVLLYVAIYFGSMVILTASADLRLALPLLVWLVIYISLLCFFLPRLQKVSKRQADARSIMTGRIVDSYTNFNTIKLFSHSRREAAYAKESMQNFLDTVHPQMRLVTQLQIGVWSANALLIFSISAIAIWLWSLTFITTGAIAIAISLALRLNGMSQWIMWEVSALFENVGVVQDGISTLAKPQTIIDEPGAQKIQIQSGLIEFKNIKFNYGKNTGLFENLSLTIQPGEKVGIVGRSGAGKSTLINLLLRFYDIDSGQISIDRQDIRYVTQESLREKIGVVTQDTSLLHRSVRENIIYGKPETDDAAMIIASKQAEAHEFIQELSDRDGRIAYDAHVGERGVKLSGGQRQRIAIARVLLKNAPILILDEATSALDSEVEAAIQNSLNTLMHNKTVIAIAHRLSTIAALDRLIVLDNGKIIEQGSHKNLIQENGIYAQLWKHQSGGFLATNFNNQMDEKIQPNDVNLAHNA